MVAAVASEPPVVHADRLLVGYDDVPVCAAVDLTLGAGDMLALVGPNGAGKSTVLRTLLGLLEPLGGSVELFGDVPDERSRAFRARTAAVLDDDAWFPGLTAREHLLLTASGHGVTRTTAVVDEAVETFGLADRQDAVPSAMSSGQRRRLLLAAAFVRPRDLLVLDEPEQRLDTGMRERLADLIAREAAAGTAVLLATHDPLLLTRLDTDAVVVDDTRCVRMPGARAVELMGA